jgi:NTE family protein
MDEVGVRPSIIAGTSIGAIVGAFYAAGTTGKEMAELSNSLGFREFTKMMDLSIFSRTGLVKGQAVQDFLLKHLPQCSFAGLQIPLKIVATDFWNRKPVVFTSGELIPAIRASISIPGLFEPYEDKGKILVDGGAVSPLPMEFIREECDILVAIDVSGSNVPAKKNKTPRLFENISVWSQIIQTRLIEQHLELYHPEIYVRPRLENVQILDFHRDKEIRRSVEVDVRQFKRRLRDTL